MENLTIADPPGFEKLSKAEQIRYLQWLWDRISNNPADVPVLDSHLVVAEARYAEYQRDPQAARSAYDVIDRLTQKPK